MAGNFQNFKIGAEKISVRRFLDQKIRFRQFDLELEPKVAKKFAIGNHGRGQRVTTDWATKLPLNPGNILDVIDMSVRQEQKFEVHTKRTHPFASALGRLNQIAIRFKNPAAKALVIHWD